MFMHTVVLISQSLSLKVNYSEKLCIKASMATNRESTKPIELKLMVCNYIAKLLKGTIQVSSQYYMLVLVFL